ASKYSAVSIRPIMANSVMLLGSDSNDERVILAKVCGKRLYFSTNSRVASAVCKSISTPPMSKTTALVVCHRGWCDSITLKSRTLRGAAQKHPTTKLLDCHRQRPVAVQRRNLSALTNYPNVR